jgi:hypothetical protein
MGHGDVLFIAAEVLGGRGEFGEKVNGEELMNEANGP